MLFDQKQPIIVKLLTLLHQKHLQILSLPRKTQINCFCIEMVIYINLIALINLVSFKKFYHRSLTTFCKRV
jgi:ATP adenylyltransferase/5',5'''-P-1,P-4-tetraphosphate phosphorylase II